MTSELLIIEEFITLEKLEERYSEPIELEDEDILEVLEEEDGIPIIVDEMYLLQLQLDSAKWLSQRDF